MKRTYETKERGRAKQEGEEGASDERSERHKGRQRASIEDKRAGSWRRDLL